MKKVYQRLAYTSPEVELLVVRFGGNLLTGSPQWSNTPNSPGEIENEDSGRTYGF